jgi:TonB family protein
MTTLIFLIALFLFPSKGQLFTPPFSVSLQTVAQDPDYAEGRNALIARDYQKAIESFSRFAAKKPKEWKAHYYLGLSHFGAKQYEQALAAFERAAELDPKSGFAQYEICKLYLEMNNDEAALKQYRWLESHNPELASYLGWPSLPLSSQANKESGSANANATPSNVIPMSTSLRPDITYKEKARYTEIARTNIVTGTVVLNMVFNANCTITNLKVVRGLPDGLTECAIEAAKKIRFTPATQGGQPVSVRGNVEFNFMLY